MLKTFSTKFDFGNNSAYSMIYSSLTMTVWPPELVFTILNILLNVTVTESHCGRGDIMFSGIPELHQYM